MIQAHYRRSLRRIILGVAMGLAASASAQVTSQTVVCGGQPYQVALYAPESPQPRVQTGAQTGAQPGAQPRVQPLPAILLLHGAGDRAENFLALWKPFAKRNHIVLVAPQLPRMLEFEAVAPAVFRCVMEDARARVSPQASIDPARIYLFGHSMGGYLGFDGAMLDSDYFAAAAIHAGDIADEYRGIVSKATRKIPIAIYVGDRDPYFPAKHVRQTRDLLIAQGFPVHYQEIADHDHDFYAVFDEVADDAWKFLQQKRLVVPVVIP